MPDQATCTAVAVRNNARCKNTATVDANGDGVLDACDQESHQRQVRSRVDQDASVRVVNALKEEIPAFVYVEDVDELPEDLTPAPPVVSSPAVDARRLAELQELSNGLFEKEERPSTGTSSSAPPAEPTTEKLRTTVVVVRGKWTPDRVRPWIEGPVHMMNDWYQDYGVDEVDDDDVDFLSEALAPAFADAMSQVDPNNPYGAALLAIVAVFGPKTFKVLKRKRAMKKGTQLRVVRDTPAPAPAAAQPGGGALDDIP